MTRWAGREGRWEPGGPSERKRPKGQAAWAWLRPQWGVGWEEGTAAGWGAGNVRSAQAQAEEAEARGPPQGSRQAGRVRSPRGG